MYTWMGKYSKIMIILSILTGISSSTFSGIWLAMELNMIVFISWCFSYNYKTTAVKYFFAQTFLSSFLLFTYSMHLLNTQSCQELIFLILWSKIGMPPWYHWFLNACYSSDYNCIFILSTFQKLLPLTLLIHLEYFTLKYFFITIFILQFHLLNLMMIKSILAFSSIFHVLWMALAIHSYTFLYIFILIYFINMFWICNIFQSLGKPNLIDDFLFFSLTNQKIIFIFLTILNLAGIPPFLGFSSKMMLMMEIMLNNTSLVKILFLSIMSYFMVYAYLRLFFLMLSQKKTTLFHALNCTPQSYTNITFILTMTSLMFLIL